MKNSIFEINKLLLNSQNTELQYFIASARADKADLITLVYGRGMDEDTKIKLEKNILKMLKQIKVSGRLDFFASKENFDSSSTEAKYILNKFPEYENVVSETDLMFCIML